MSRLPGKDTPRFVELTDRRSEFVVCSRVEWWVSHWDTQRGRSRRCSGGDCALCSIGSPKVTRFIVMAVNDRGREVLIELRERHRDVLERIDQAVSNGDGVRIVARKEGTARNSPVNVQVLSKEACFRREIALLVQSFGLPALRGPMPAVGEAVGGEPAGLNVSHPPLPENPG